MADAGLKLVVTGEKEFKSALQSINEVIRNNNKTLELLTKEYEVNGNAADTLVSKSKVLADSIVTQGNKVDLLRQQYNEAAEQFGESDKRVEALASRLRNAEDDLASLTAAQEENTAALSRSGEEWQQLKATLAQSDAEIQNLEASYEGLSDTSAGLTAKQENLKEQEDKLSTAITTQKKYIDSLNTAQNEAAEKYGTGSKKAKKYKTEIDDATSALGDMETKLKDVGEKIVDVDSQMTDLDEAPDKLNSGLGAVEEYVADKIPGGIELMNSGFELTTGTVGAIVTALGTVAVKLGELYADTAEEASELVDTSMKLNLNTEEYEALEYAAQKAQIPIETLESFLNDLNNEARESDKVLADYMDGTKSVRDATDEEIDAINEATEYWDNLGISLYDTNGNLKDTKTLFYDIIQKFENMGQTSERTSAMLELFGDNFSDFTDAVNVGADAMKEWEDEAYEVGYVTDSQLTAKLDAANTSLNNLKLALKTKLKDFWNYILGGDYNFTGADMNYYASGTYNHPGGLAVVGERGPEIVDLPTGSKVYPNGTKLGGESNVYNITIDAASVSEFNDIVRMAQSARQSLRG